MTNNYINHIALVLDGSGSMSHLKSQVVQIADSQIAYLAQRSKELDQETRITIYGFFDTRDIQCLVYDKDVLRLPSIKSLYKTQGQTPLIDATIKAISDLERTATLYGEHSFLIYVLTDGAENASTNRPDKLKTVLASLPENWTLATFVPNAVGVSEAKKFGFSPDNIQIWDTSSRGISEVGEVIRRTSDTYLTNRTRGIRGYRNLFTFDSSNLTSRAVQTNLDALHFGQFRLFSVDREGRIDEFVEKQLRRPYRLGEAYYELMVPVKVQPQKQILLYEKRTSKIFKGDQARTLLGLPDYEVKVAPDHNPNYDIFIQSTSVNRKLLKDQRVIVLS